jgi:hypothetical protein
MFAFQLCLAVTAERGSPRGSPSYGATPVNRSVNSPRFYSASLLAGILRSFETLEHPPNVWHASLLWESPRRKTRKRAPIYNICFK